MLKLIPHIADGSWMIRQSVGTTPVILGKALKTVYTVTPQYIEMDIDISANNVASYVTGLVRGATKSLVIDMGFVLEGTVPWELPEALLGTLRLNYLDLKFAKKINVEHEYPLRPPMPTVPTSREFSVSSAPTGSGPPVKDNMAALTGTPPATRHRRSVSTACTPAAKTFDISAFKFQAASETKTTLHSVVYVPSRITYVGERISNTIRVRQRDAIVSDEHRASDLLPRPPAAKTLDISTSTFQAEQAEQADKAEQAESGPMQSRSPTPSESGKNMK
eukprot:gene12255-15400_t